jgi:hypothetical protein
VWRGEVAAQERLTRLHQRRAEAEARDTDPVGSPPIGPSRRRHEDQEVPAAAAADPMHDDQPGVVGPADQDLWESNEIRMPVCAPCVMRS